MFLSVHGIDHVWASEDSLQELILSSMRTWGIEHRLSGFYSNYPYLANLSYYESLALYFVVLGIKPRTSWMIGKNSTIE